jgi:rsbT co-antagonist protein RsbR
VGLSADSSARIAGLLEIQRDQIVKRWAAVLQQTLRGRLTEAELSRDLNELYDTLLESLRSGGTVEVTGHGAAELRALLTELSRNRARRGYSPTETASAVFALKEAVLEATDGENAQAMSDFAHFSRFVDELGLFTFEGYMQTREKVIVEQAEQLLELSTPVIKLWDGVMAVPLVGTLDSARAQVVMEKLLQTLVETSSGYAIIDITGVPAVDSQVAQHILKTVMAARLMGAECIISGIRPQIAQTVVSLGIEFGDIVTRANIADALLHALRAGGADVVRRVSRDAR